MKVLPRFSRPGRPARTRELVWDGDREVAAHLENLHHVPVKARRPISDEKSIASTSVEPPLVSYTKHHTITV
jgi:hypothetical protein